MVGSTPQPRSEREGISKTTGRIFAQKLLASPSSSPHWAKFTPKWSSIVNGRHRTATLMLTLIDHGRLSGKCGPPSRSSRGRSGATGMNSTPHGWASKQTPPFDLAGGGDSAKSDRGSFMSLSQPLAAGRRSRDEEPLVGSCTARVLILIDIAELPAAAAAEKRANGSAPGGTARAAAGVVDGLRLSVLRVLTRLCLSCPVSSWVEWAPRFFDSRPGGVGKTPAELRARLRSPQVPQGVRGFRKVTQASFATFGDACLAMVCGTQGDPLARDRETALRRWAHGQKKHPPTW